MACLRADRSAPWMLSPEIVFMRATAPRSLVDAASTREDEKQSGSGSAPIEHLAPRHQRHSHSDHSPRRGADRRKHDIPIYCSAGTHGRSDFDLDETPVSSSRHSTSDRRVERHFAKTHPRARFNPSSESSPRRLAPGHRQRSRYVNDEFRKPSPLATASSSSRITAPRTCGGWHSIPGASVAGSGPHGRCRTPTPSTPSNDALPRHSPPLCLIPSRREQPQCYRARQCATRPSAAPAPLIVSSPWPGNNPTRHPHPVAHTDAATPVRVALF